MFISLLTIMMHSTTTMVLLLSANFETCPLLCPYELISHQEVVKNISVIFVVQSIRTPGGAFLMVSSFASQSWLFSPTIIAPAPATLLRNEESCGRIDSLSLLMIDLFSFVHNNKSSFLFLILLHRDIKSLYGASTTSTSIMIRPTSWVAGAMVSVVLNI